MLHTVHSKQHRIFAVSFILNLNVMYNFWLSHIVIFVVGLLLSGFTAFAPKFLESQFSLSAGLAAQFVGKLA